MKRILWLLIACGAVLFMAATSTGADRDEQHKGKLRGYFMTKPWTGGTLADALVQSAILSTITMSKYSFPATKDNSAYTGAIVGRSPFDRGKTTTTISVKLIPVKVTIDSTTFDPTVANSCTGATHSAVELVQNSPLFLTHSLNMNMVDEGTTQYMDAFRRAEFDSLVGGYPYHTMLSLSTLPAYTLTTTSTAGVGHGNTTLFLTPTFAICPLGTLSNFHSSTDQWLDTMITGTILPSYGAQLGPTDFVFLVFDNVVQSTDDLPPTFGPCCILGYHSATGVVIPQTYGTADYDSGGPFGTGISDLSVSVHEVAEWLDDPLGTNPTPAWGHIGQVSGCQTNLENGDPLSGTLAPAISMPNGVTYNPQELAFFSWFFNSQHTASLGAGGKFSSNGTFGGPAKACPPGGTF